MSRLPAGLAIAVVAALLSSAPAPAQPRTTTADCQPLSLRQRAAQTVMTGLPGTRVGPRTRQLVGRHAGSVVLFERNLGDREQLWRYVRRLDRAAGSRLLVAVDEEGGRVSRLADRGLVDPLPSARWLGRNRTPAQVRALGRRLGRQMADLGVDWNLAPVLDVVDAPADSVIGDRSYGSRARKVARYGGAFARGLAEGGVRTTGKHFPGHGRTRVDSHDRLPTVRASLSTLRRTDLVPFAAAAPHLDAVMSAHVRYTALDDRRPASLSRATTRLLRDEIGYDGVLVTDALEMGAVSARWTVPAAAERALRAGADVALVGDWRQTRQVTDRLVEAVREGRLRRPRLDAAVGRILALKGHGPARRDCLLR